MALIMNTDTRKILIHYQIGVSQWVPLSYGFVPHLSKKLSKLPLANWSGNGCIVFGTL